jgi:hypothetical protein
VLALGVAFAYFCNEPPPRLSYRGLGEIAVGVCYGPLIACGTFLVQRGPPTPPATETDQISGVPCLSAADTVPAQGDPVARGTGTGTHE